MTQKEFEDYIKEKDIEIVALLTTINRLINGFGQEQKGDGSLADILLHLLITQLDIFVSVKHMEICKVSNNEYEEYYFARIVALGCFDVLDNLNMFEDKLLKYRTAPGTSRLMDEVNKKKAELDLISSKHLGKIRTIRHSLIAHRDRLIGVEQNKSMRALDTAEVYDIALQILTIRNNLIIALFDVRTAVGENPDQPITG